MRDPGRLHVITDEALGGRYGHVELGRIAAAAGAHVVQFREKRAWTTRQLVETVRELVGVVGARARVLVDDRVDVALACAAGGVHLGADDLAPSVARRVLGRRAWIGATAHDVAEAERLAGLGVDYLGVGPVFATRSKGDAANARPPLGLDGLARIVRSTGLPVIAIGGLTPERAVRALEAGAHGVAVLWDVAGREDPGGRVAELREAIDGVVRDGERRTRPS